MSFLTKVWTALGWDDGDDTSVSATSPDRAGSRRRGFDRIPISPTPRQSLEKTVMPDLCTRGMFGGPRWPENVYFIITFRLDNTVPVCSHRSGTQDCGRGRSAGRKVVRSSTLRLVGLGTGVMVCVIVCVCVCVCVRVCVCLGVCV